MRLILSFALIVLVSITSLVALVRLRAENEVHAFMFPGGMASAQELVRGLQRYYGTHRSWEGVESVLDVSMHGQGTGQGNMGMMQGMMSQQILLADAQGKVVYDSSKASTGGQLDSTDLERALTLEYQQQTVGYLLLQGGMGFTQGDQRLLVSRLTRAAILAGLIAGILALALAMVLAYGLLRPVRELTVAAERLAQGDLSQRVQVRSEDELGRLGRTFNQMASSLQQAVDSRRAMTADIAHELRNPLAVQRAHLEALQDGIYPLSPQNLEPILEQNQQLTRLVEDLRTLALADAGQLELECVPTDLTLLVPRVVDRFSPQADGQGVRLDVTIPQGCPEVRVDPGRIEQILANLISNALRHTPAQGRIGIQVDCLSEMIEIRVHDSGTGIPQEALPHIFERFYRADKSRSRVEGGTGLGLAIARQLAQAHGGQLSGANHPQGGSMFILSLPVDSAKT